MKIKEDGTERFITWPELSKMLETVSTGRRFWVEGKPLVLPDGREIIYLGAN